jgi:hypothetical protein
MVGGKARSMLKDGAPLKQVPDFLTNIGISWKALKGLKGTNDLAYFKHS